jgi:hypothetical protein
MLSIISLYPASTLSAASFSPEVYFIPNTPPLHRDIIILKSPIDDVCRILAATQGHPTELQPEIPSLGESSDEIIAS